MQKFIAALLLGGLLTVTGSADDVPPATAPAVVADSDVVKDWIGSVAFGLSLANGNSSAYQINSASSLDKQWKKDEWHFGANGAYAVTNPNRDDQDTTANNVHGGINYRHLFDERLYATAGFEAMHDDVADVTYRLITSPGIGYYFIKEPTLRLRGEAGPSWIYERDSGSAPGTKNYFAARFAERLEKDFGKNAKFWQSLEYLPRIDDWGDYLLNAEVGVEAAMTEALSLRLVGRDQYNSNPPEGRKSNDISVIAAVAYKFGK